MGGVSLVERARRWLASRGGPRIRVHVLVRGNIGGRWYEVDRVVRVPEGTTLAELVAASRELGVPLDEAIAASPHLRDTIMLNGERCPVDAEGGRRLADGDELYLLSPLVGG